MGSRGERVRRWALRIGVVSLLPALVLEPSACLLAAGLTAGWALPFWLVGRALRRTGESRVAVLLGTLGAAAAGSVATAVLVDAGSIGLARVTALVGGAMLMEGERARSPARARAAALAAVALGSLGLVVGSSPAPGAGLGLVGLCLVAIGLGSPRPRADAPRDAGRAHGSGGGMGRHAGRARALEP
ncbi:MAG: hypothetical protein JWM98_2124 [Thermoleophilia bacterium]|nr:hypothetical protein [Thermoleophilia bacterium]